MPCLVIFVSRDCPILLSNSCCNSLPINLILLRQLRLELHLEITHIFYWKSTAPFFIIIFKNEVIVLFLFKNVQIRANITNLDVRVFFFVLKVVDLGTFWSWNKDGSTLTFLSNYQVIIKSIINDVARDDFDDFCFAEAARTILEDHTKIQKLIFQFYVIWLRFNFNKSTKSLCSPIENFGPLIPWNFYLCLKWRREEKLVFMSFNHNVSIDLSWYWFNLCFNQDINIGLVYNHKLWIDL